MTTAIGKVLWLGKRVRELSSGDQVEMGEMVDE